MQDKHILINSMNNLINHILISRKNQQQMFASLTRTHIDKIIANLEDSLGSSPFIYNRTQSDDSPTSSLADLQQFGFETKILLDYGHSIQPQLQCNWFQIQIVINNNLSRILHKYKQKDRQIFNLLKSHDKFRQQNGYRTSLRREPPLLWYINPRNNKLAIQYLYKEDISNVVSILSTNKVSMQPIFDPIDCIFGITISEVQAHQQSVQMRIPSSLTTESSQNKNMIQNNQNTFQNSKGSITTRAPVHIQQSYLPMPIKNITFLKPSNSKQINNSFSHETNSQIKSNYRDTAKNFRNQQYLLNSSMEASHYVNSPTSFSIIPYSNTSKKQNDQKFSISQKDKNSNRLSLQMHELRGPKKTQTFETQPGITVPQNKGHGNTHIHGIKLLTPRHSLKNGPKISISSYGNQTQRNKTEAFSIYIQGKDKERITDLNHPVFNQKVKTIYLGKGRGAETARQRKNIKIERH